METKLTTGAYYLKRGDTFDPEDFRMTHRLGVARSILMAQGFVPEKAHSARCVDERNVIMSYRQGCDSGCKTTWTGLPSNDVFNAAFALADAIQNNKRATSQAAINAAKAGA